AEGVETIEDLNILKSMKADYIQGYLFSKPISKQEILDKIL
ncbi:MAG: EAL domain-containing protein, partial [Cetobacterium sp.]